MAINIQNMCGNGGSGGGTSDHSQLTAGDGITIDANNVISADAQVFLATYGVTTFQDIRSAFAAKKAVICNYDTRQYRLYRASQIACIFTCDYADDAGDYQYSIVLSAANTWGQYTFDRRQPLIDYVDNIVGNVETAINEIRGGTAE